MPERVSGGGGDRASYHEQSGKGTKCTKVQV